MTLYRLSYISHAAETRGTMREYVSKQISEVSSKSNKAMGISMVLVHVDDYFIQVLEGSRNKLSYLITKIMSDERHSHVEIVGAHPLTSRSFVGQYSKIFDINSQDNALFQKYTMDEKFNPYELVPDAMDEMLDRIIKIGQKA
ncbi:MAG: BLUF domain-containing protein [Pseudomonadota bacterium]